MAAKSVYRTTESTSDVRNDSLLSVQSDDQEFETDLEDDVDEDNRGGHWKFNLKTTAERYFEACETLSTVPGRQIPSTMSNRFCRPQALRNSGYWSAGDRYST